MASVCTVSLTCQKEENRLVSDSDEGSCDSGEQIRELCGVILKKESNSICNGPGTTQIKFHYAEKRKHW